MDDQLKRVQKLWNEHLCGKHFIQADYPSKEFFERYREFRYKKEHHLNHLINWQSAAGKDVLELGLGIGADATRWAANARSFTGIDLTAESVLAARAHLDSLGLKGGIVKGDGESLPFADEQFDIVYSHGVLHHTPEIDKAMKEIHRVLKISGILIAMLYTKDSFNFWIRIQLYFRLRFLYALLRRMIGLKNSEPWTSHIRNLEKKGWRYFSWNNWYHHCTDGPDCEIANIYHRAEVVDMLKKAGLRVETMKKAHLPLGLKFPALERFLAGFIGFYLFIWAKKNETTNP